MKWKWFFIQRSKIVTKETERADNIIARNATATANERKTPSKSWEVGESTGATVLGTDRSWCWVLGIRRLSRVLSFCFLSSGLKLIGMNFLWPESKQTRRPAEEAQTFGRVPAFHEYKLPSCADTGKQWFYIPGPTPLPWSLPPARVRMSHPHLASLPATLIKVSVREQFFPLLLKYHFSVYPNSLNTIKTHLRLAIWF